eukprot:COSAG05_NODE_1546_length_4588_cov_3.851637_5_plen_53_part_00
MVFELQIVWAQTVLWGQAVPSSVLLLDQRAPEAVKRVFAARQEGQGFFKRLE